MHRVVDKWPNGPLPILITFIRNIDQLRCCTANAIMLATEEIDAKDGKKGEYEGQEHVDI